MLHIRLGDLHIPVSWTHLSTAASSLQLSGYGIEICTGAVTGTNPGVSAGIPRERGRILTKTRGNDGNGNDFCGNTANSFGNLDRQWTILVLMHCSGLDDC